MTAISDLPVECSNSCVFFLSFLNFERDQWHFNQEIDLVPSLHYLVLLQPTKHIQYVCGSIYIFLWLDSTIWWSVSVWVRVVFFDQWDVRIQVTGDCIRRRLKEFLGCSFGPKVDSSIWCVITVYVQCSDSITHGGPKFDRVGIECTFTIRMIFFTHKPAFCWHFSN